MFFNFLLSYFLNLWSFFTYAFKNLYFLNLKFRAFINAFKNLYFFLTFQEVTSRV